jgi:hypothetical protein
MQYFLLKDDISPEGDTYRYDGTNFQMRNFDGSWGFEHGPANGESYSEFLDALVGPYGAWEEIEVP